MFILYNKVILVKGKKAIIFLVFAKEAFIQMSFKNQFKTYIVTFKMIINKKKTISHNKKVKAFFNCELIEFISPEFFEVNHIYCLLNSFKC